MVFTKITRFRLPRLLICCQTRCYSVRNQNSEIQLEGEEFSLLMIPGHTNVDKKKQRTSMVRRPVPPPRYMQMDLNEDWTDRWPTVHSFKWSAVPLPLRQGHIIKNENSGIPPGKYANAELMKIPNFLHLTPVHIKKHCAAIKEFCTDWPAKLTSDTACNEHFPVVVISSDYVKDHPHRIDERGRTAVLRVHLSSLHLDYHARDKLIRLVGDRYDEDEDLLTLKSERCPTKKQNLEYLRYLLAVLYSEAWKVEEWESEKQEEDWEKFVFEVNCNHSFVIETAKRHLPKEEGAIEESVMIKMYKKAIENLHNHGEDHHSLDEYKRASLNLLIPQSRSP